jgi:MscS family membrane protein
MNCQSLSVSRTLCGLTLVAFLVGSPALGTTRIQNPLKPPDTTSPRGTLESFMSVLDRAYRIADAPGTQEDVLNLGRRALRTLDLSEFPPNFRNDFGFEAALMLKEVLDRIDLPPPDEIPGQAEVQGMRQNALAELYDSLRGGGSQSTTPGPFSAATGKWTIPNTEITIGQVAEGPRKGEWLFTPDTVERASIFYERVRHLPYKADATPNIYAAYAATPGHLNKRWDTWLPGWSKQIIVGQSVWQWVATLLTGLMLTGLILLLLRQGRRWDGRERAGHDQRHNWRLGTLIALGASVVLLRSADWFLDDVVNLTGVQLATMSWTLYLVRIGLVCWLVALALDEGAELLIRARRLAPKAAPSQLIRFFSGLIAVFAILGILIFTTQQMGLPAYSVVTGLGVGGLAVALAGQEMLRDLFGAVVIMASRPYRIGDWVVIGNQEGTVESIGFRSTRIRTFYDSLLSIPNGVVVSKTIDNMGMRTYRRIYTKLSIRDDTPAERIEAFLEGIKRIIQANPSTRKDYFHVVLNDFGKAGLDIMLYFFVKVPTWSEELVERQRVFLEVVRLAEALGIQIAPTQQIETLRGRPTEQTQTTASDEELRRIAADFGDDGASARPRGSKIFVAPHEESGQRT